MRVPFGGLWAAERLGPQGRAWAGRLGTTEAAAIAALGDGARWIGRQAERDPPGAAGLPDIYRASEYRYGAARAP